MSTRLLIICGLSVLGAAIPLCGRDKAQSLSVTNTERVHLAAGGTVRFDNSYGYLTVEGWDQRDVEITVVRSTDKLYDASRKERVEQRFDQVRVVAERSSANEVAIATVLPVRNSLFTSVLPSGHIVFTRPLLPNNKRGITVEYQVRVPRDSHLVIRQDNGYIWVNGVTGDIEVKSHTGDMIVVLPDPGSCRIDAQTGLGRISADFAGRTRNKFLFGELFAHNSETRSRRVYLRMGRGSITLKTGSTDGFPE